MSSTASSADGTTGQTISPRRAIHVAIRDLERLPLRSPWVNGQWRAHYLGTIRMYADMLADDLVEERDRRRRTSQELIGLYYMTRVAQQIAKIVSMDEEADIIPQMHYEHGLKFIVLGDDVVAEVLFRDDARIFLTLRNNISGIEPVTVELNDEGLTPVAAFVVASVYFSPLTPQTTPKHLRWMWDLDANPDVASTLREYGVDISMSDVMVVPHANGVYVEVIPQG